MTFMLSREAARLERWNDQLNRFTTRKLYHLYRAPGAFLLVEYWGWKPGKGYARAFRSIPSLRREIQNRAEKEGLQFYECAAYRLCAFDDEIKQWDSLDHFSRYIESTVSHSAQEAIFWFNKHTVGHGRYESEDALLTESFYDLWNLKVQHSAEELMDDIEAPLPEVAYSNWGGFA